MYDEYLYHHGILGQKWGVRRYQNADGTLTTAGKKRYSEETDKEETDKEENDTQNKSVKDFLVDHKKEIAIGAATVAGTAMVIGGVYLYKKDIYRPHEVEYNFGKNIDINTLSNVDKVIPKNTKFQRVSSVANEKYSDNDKIYTSYLKKDNRVYKEEMPKFIKRWGDQGIINDDGKNIYIHNLTMNKNIKVASERAMAKAYMKANNVSKLDSGRYQQFMSDTLTDKNNPTVQKFFKEIKNMGYDAVIDLNDAGRYTKSPIIIFEPASKIAVNDVHKLKSIEKFINTLLV